MLVKSTNKFSNASFFSAEDPPAVIKLTESSVLINTPKIDLKRLSRTINSVTAEASSVPCESYYGRNRIEKWIVDSSAAPLDPDVRPASAISTLPMTSETHHFKMPQLLSKRGKVKPAETQPAAETAPVPDLHLVQLDIKKQRLPGPLHSFYTPGNARYMDDSCKEHCMKNKNLSMSGLMAEKTPASLSNEPSDVYTFDEAEPSKEQILGYNAKRLIPKETKNMYLDLPEDSAHIVKLVEVKMPNQTKPIMRARLVPKSLVNKSDTLEKELKNNGERLGGFPVSSSTSNNSSVKNDAEGSDKGSDSKPLSSYKKGEQTSETLSEVLKDVKPVVTVEAPTFYPTEDEFEVSV